MADMAFAKRALISSGETCEQGGMAVVFLSFCNGAGLGSLIVTLHFTNDIEDRGYADME
ncbi:hypothetical protein [Gluconobacter oxydans]|uniref:hypothetical protein n=1 Tax=Gluconobacter oxydans TaxID=442 RepID=UPI001558775C|nr:hypothetical protein [Gluconobacter oxydans]